MVMTPREQEGVFVGSVRSMVIKAWAVDAADAFCMPGQAHRFGVVLLGTG